MTNTFNRLICALLVLAVPVSPGLAKKAKPVSIATPETTVKALYAGFAAGDMPKILSLISPAVTWIYHAPVTLLPFAGTYTGKKGVGDFFAADAKYVEVKGNDINSFIAEGDRVAVLGEERGIVRATGKSFVAQWVHIFQVDKGLITKFDEHIDSAAIVAAMH